jgi:hypothetical protein
MVSEKLLLLLPSSRKKVLSWYNVLDSIMID